MTNLRLLGGRFLFSNRPADGRLPHRSSKAVMLTHLQSRPVGIHLSSMLAALGPGPSSSAPQPQDGRGHISANEALHPHIVFMKGTEERKQQLEAAISEALQREAERHNAAVKNMHRLRALRLERGQKPAGGEGRDLVGRFKNKSAPNGPSPINEPPPPI